MNLLKLMMLMRNEMKEKKMMSMWSCISAATPQRIHADSKNRKRVLGWH